MYKNVNRKLSWTIRCVCLPTSTHEFGNVMSIIYYCVDFLPGVSFRILVSTISNHLSCQWKQLVPTSQQSRNVLADLSSRFIHRNLEPFLWHYCTLLLIRIHLIRQTYINRHNSNYRNTHNSHYRNITISFIVSSQKCKQLKKPS